MKPDLLRCAVAGVFVALLAGGEGAGAEGARVDRLISFSLTDQFDRDYTAGTFAGKVVVLMIGDKTGSGFTRLWGPALGEPLAASVGVDSFAIVPVADLTAVPFFIRGIARSQFPSNRNEWALMDWEGVFADAYGLEKRKCNLIVFDRSHRLVHREAVTDLDRERVDELVTLIGELATGGAEQ